MRIFKKPAVLILLAAIIVAAYYWKSHVSPLSKALYVTAEGEFTDGNYRKSLELLHKAYRYNPLDSAIMNLMGWNYLKLRNFADARRYFGRALFFDSKLYDARLGMAFTFLEMEKPADALKYFLALPEKQRQAADVRVAMARCYELQGMNDESLKIIEGVLREDPSNKLARRRLAELTGAEDLDTLAKIPAPPPEKKRAQLEVAARLRDGHFEIPQGGEWKSFYMAGVNIGPATPGHFATEPPYGLNTYREWLDLIGAMGANCVRVYTLLPPGFYRALYMYNADHADRPLYLFQEIWLNEPPLDNLWDKKFTGEFQGSLWDVVDALHGRASLPFKQWQAGGIYSADVSPYVIGWLVGREIEPHVVITTNLRNPGVTKFTGHYLSISGGNPTEVWLTARCEDIIQYEVERYNCQRPVAFVNWPPLDPLHHPTEARLEDELRIRRKLGEKLAPLGEGVQDDTDVVSVDEEKVEPQPAFEAGYFALYHVYPFWPDFVFMDPVYRQARDAEGINSYWGYLQALKAHYQRTPVVIGEYGLSTSIGIAHFTPSGLNHGGLSEVEQGQGVVRLTRDIQQAGFAGGIIFEWIDEWWKHNWIAVNFEKPFERKAFWHNELDPEQFFGLLKFVPPNPLVYSLLTRQPLTTGAASTAPAPQGPPRVKSIQAAWDPSALYLDLNLDAPPDTAVDWSQGGYLVALNTCDAPCGSGAVPDVGDITLQQGANFLVDLNGRDSSKLLVAHNYNPYREVPVQDIPDLTDIIIPRDMKIDFNRQGKFEDMIVEANRRRYAPDGTFFPARRYSRSILRYGNFHWMAADFDSLGEWYDDAGNSRLRLRLPWGLLLALDPSEGFVFNGTDDQAVPTGKISKHIQVAVIAYAPGAGATSGAATQIMGMQVSGNVIEKGWPMDWPTWSSVTAEAVPKKSYSIIAQEFKKLTGYPSTEGGR